MEGRRWVGEEKDVAEWATAGVGEECEKGVLGFLSQLFVKWKKGEQKIMF